MAVMIEHLTKRFGSFTALDDVSLTMENGIFGLLGKNGAGKTTLMRILTTLWNPRTGLSPSTGSPLICSMPGRSREKSGICRRKPGSIPI